MIAQILACAALNPLPSVRGLAARVLPTREHPIAGRTVLLTGASSGVGEAAAHLLADRGARLVLVARGAEGLEAVRDEVRRSGGTAEALPCDLTDPDAVAELARTVAADIGPVDVLVNNAGRSIRRTVEDTTDRFHDYERTMALNYFGPVRLTLALLPAMLERGSGHVVNVATWGVPGRVMPKFAAYHASKAAISAFGRDLGAEVAGRGVAVSTVHFPLIRTPMIAPTKDYDAMAALTPRQAASWLADAIATRPVEVMPAYAELLRVIDTVSPSLTDALVRRAGI